MTLPWDKRLTGSIEAAVKGKANKSHPRTKTANDGVTKSRPNSSRRHNSSSMSPSAGNNEDDFYDDIYATEETLNNGEMDTIHVANDYQQPSYEDEGVCTESDDTCTEQNMPTAADECSKNNAFFSPNDDMYPNPETPWHRSSTHGRIAYEERLQGRLSELEQRWSETANLPQRRSGILQKPQQQVNMNNLPDTSNNFDQSNIDPLLRSPVISTALPTALPTAAAHTTTTTTKATFVSANTLNMNRHNAKSKTKRGKSHIGQTNPAQLSDFYNQLEKQRTFYAPQGLGYTQSHPSMYAKGLQTMPPAPQPAPSMPTPIDKFRAAQLGGGQQQRRYGTAFSTQYMRAGMRASMLKSGMTLPPKQQQPPFRFPPIPTMNQYVPHVPQPPRMQMHGMSTPGFPMVSGPPMV